MKDKYQQCKRCVMDNISDDTITFDENGYCNYCSDTLKRMNNEYFPNEKGKEKLEELFENIKREGRGKRYDCIVGVSGGVDSSYILYLGYKYQLRMLAVHIDDGLDTVTASENIKKICKKTNTELVQVIPKIDEYKDAILSFFKANVPNIAIIQDNLIVSELYLYARKYNINYSLAGGNFACESILQRGNTHNAFDLKHIKDIEKKYGSMRWSNLPLIGFFHKYIKEKYFTKVKKVYPLNFMKYDLEEAIETLHSFCGYEYYGGKHYESTLIRFMQCYYLPEKFLVDKRKSHYSSLIVSGQMTRKEAIEKLQENTYIDSGLMQDDLKYLSNYFGISKEEFERILNGKARSHEDYTVSIINRMAPIARKFRKYLG